MMLKRTYSMLLPPLLFALPAIVADARPDELHQSIQQRSEAAVLEDATAVEQARVQAQRQTGYRFEVRPFITEDDAGAALRIYLPARWGQAKLRSQLALAAESEQLRVAALEWQELIKAYRQFCDYRMLQKQLALFDHELKTLEPSLEQADRSVELNQLNVTERAKLYSLYLDWVNGREKTRAALLDVEQQLHLLLGAKADLARLAESAVVKMPPRLEFESLMQQALTNRSDYRQFDVAARSLNAAEGAARSEDGFRLKYLQPSYAVDYDNGDSRWGLSASFVLPWGTRNPDIAVYQQQHALALSSMELQRTVIQERLRVLLQSAQSYYGLAEERSDKIKPLLTQLAQDMEQMDTGRIEDLRDLMAIRERIFDVSLQTTRAIRKKEQIAVDLAEELGTVAQRPGFK